MRFQTAALCAIGVVVVLSTGHLLVRAAPVQQTGTRAANDDASVTYGAGLFTCGRWTSDRRDVVMRGVETQWVLGWISGADYSWAVMRKLKTQFPELNKFPFTAHSPTDGDAIEAWMNKYCADHPLDTVLDGTKALSLELQRRAEKR